MDSLDLFFKIKNLRLFFNESQNTSNAFKGYGDDAQFLYLVYLSIVVFTNNTIHVVDRSKTATLKR